MAVLHCLHSASASLSQARQAHAHILKTGVSNDTHLSTKLLSLYANHHCFSDANLVLYSTPQPAVSSYSTLIFACTKSSLFAPSLRFFSQMLSRGLAPDTHVLPSVIKACASTSALKAGKLVHGIVCVSGFSSDYVVQSSLVHMYLKCDQVRHARKLFDEMALKDVVSCSALLAGYARKGCVEEAIGLLSQMGKLSVEPNLVSWNGLIAGFSGSAHYNDAILVFQKMHLEGFKPDGIAISSVLPAVGDLEKLDTGRQIHGFLVKQGLEQDNCVVSALIDMYGKCACDLDMLKILNKMDQMDTGACNAVITGLSRNGSVEKALELFTQFKEQGVVLNVISWTSVIAGCSQNGKDIEALELFREMQNAGVRPNSVTIPCLLPACGNIAALIHGKAAHCFSLRSGISDNVYVGSALIDMYAKCGRIHISRLCFDKMPVKNLVCWNAIMGGYAMHGKAKESIDIFQSLLTRGLKPDFISFTCVLAACSQGGLTDEGWRYFDNMSRDHKIEARLEHYACMVTLLGRAGKLDEAYNMIKQMPFEPDACVWGALLSSCRVHNNVHLGEAAAKKLIELEPNNPGNYVLLSNIYASKGMWTEVDTVRNMMKSKGLKKNPGCSWIQVKNKMHMLLAGDKSLPQMTQIIEKLNELSMEMKRSGYFPSVDFVLQDVEEQDKEQILCGHSEKLAVVFGLLNTPPRSSLQVIKNLRICGDCHAVIKFISKLEARSIFVRDTNRFHHFEDGVCSCGDYW